MMLSRMEKLFIVLYCKLGSIAVLHNFLECHHSRALPPLGLQTNHGDRCDYLSDPGSNQHHWIIQAWSCVFFLNLLFSLWCRMRHEWKCLTISHALQSLGLCELQNFCSQLVLALCRDSERIRDPSAGVAAAVEDPLSLTQAERRRREMQRPVKLCESKFWNLCPMKRFFSWILDTEHGLFFFLTGWAHYKNVFISSSSLKPGSPARQESGGRTLSITESGSATLQVVIAESWTMFLLSRTKGRDDASVWSCCMVLLSHPHN